MQNIVQVNADALSQALTMLGGQPLTKAATVIYKAVDEAEVRGYLSGEKAGFQSGFSKGLEQADRNYEDGHKDGWSTGYAEGVNDARLAPTKADIILAGLAKEEDPEVEQIMYCENPEERNEPAIDEE